MISFRARFCQTKSQGVTPIVEATGQSETKPLVGVVKTNEQFGARSGTLLLETGGIVRGQGEAIRPERIPIHLTEIIGDLTVAFIGVLELQNRLVHFYGGSAYLDRATASA